MIHESVGNPSSKLPRGVRRGSTTGLQGMERMSLGGELVLVSACLTVTPPITGGQEHTHTISRHLQRLLTELLCLSGSPPTDSTPLDPGPVAPSFLASLSHDDVVRLVHHPGSTPLPVHLCDCSNGSNTKTHWTLEDVHWALGCHWFWNYKHIIQTSLDGQWVDGGEFPMSLGSYALIPKVACGRPITREQSFFLDHVNVDIAFGDCISVGGFCYALIFVDRSTRYNWVFGLKDLLADSILTAFRLFWADAGSYAWCF